MTMKDGCERSVRRLARVRALAQRSVTTNVVRYLISRRKTRIFPSRSYNGTRVMRVEYLEYSVKYDMPISPLTPVDLTLGRHTLHGLVFPDDKI
jgi:hypothetical protein